MPTVVRCFHLPMNRILVVWLLFSWLFLLLLYLSAFQASQEGLPVRRLPVARCIPRSFMPLVRRRLHKHGPDLFFGPGPIPGTVLCSRCLCHVSNGSIGRGFPCSSRTDIACLFLRRDQSSANRAILLPLQPTLQTIEVEAVTTGQPLWRHFHLHVLPAHDTHPVTPVQIRRRGRRKSIFHVAANLAEPQKRPHPRHEIAKRPVDVPHQVDRNAVGRKHHEEKRCIRDQVDHIPRQIDIKHGNRLAPPRPVASHVDQRERVLEQYRKRQRRLHAILERKQQMGGNTHPENALQRVLQQTYVHHRKPDNHRHQPKVLHPRRIRRGLDKVHPVLRQPVKHLDERQQRKARDEAKRLHVMAEDGHRQQRLDNRLPNPVLHPLHLVLPQRTQKHPHSSLVPDQTAREPQVTQHKQTQPRAAEGLHRREELIVRDQRVIHHTQRKTQRHREVLANERILGDRRRIRALNCTSNVFHVSTIPRYEWVLILARLPPTGRRNAPR